MGLLLLLPMLLLGGLVLGGPSGDDDGPDTPSEDAGDVDVGTSGSEELAGTALDDILLGAGGRDTIEGLAGDDVIAGEFNNDVLTGASGDDVVLGGGGNDFVDGSTGDGLLIGGAGTDTLTGGTGDDVPFGSSGSDVLRGGDGNDMLVGLEFDRISGDLADSAATLRGAVTDTFGNTVTDQQVDRLVAGVRSGDVTERGPDQLEGGAGNDLLIGDDGDTMAGDDGVDAFGIAYSTGNAVTQITDFNYQTETLTLLVDNPDTAQIEIRADGATTTLVLVDGQPVARLLNQTAADLLGNPSSWLELERA
jgi:Ca2+-binding RTX toxin-like protein